MKSLKKVMAKVPMKKLMYNRGVLYALCILALFNLIMYANARDFNSVITMLIVGVLMSFFSKNMIIILAVAIGVTYLLNYNSVKLISEGAENMKKEGEESAEETAEESAEETAEKSAEETTEESAEETAEESADGTDEDKKKMYDELQTDFKDFQKIQDSILTGMKEIDPLLTKAETFIEKFEHYGKKLEKTA
jgi:hypothetical protein